MNNIRSLHIDTEKTWRGGEQQVLYLVRVLKREGTFPLVVCQKGSELTKMLEAEGIPFREISMRSEFDIISAMKIAKIVNSENVDIVHAHTSHAHSLALLASVFSKRGVKKVVSRRVDFRLRNNPLNKLKYSIPDMYITVSDAIKEIMTDCGVPTEKIAVVHSGVDTNKFPDANKDGLIKEFGLSENEKIIGNIAHLADHKGQKYLIDAFHMLIKEVDNVKLFIVGEGELESALKEQANKLGIEDKVVFTGFRKDVGDFLKLFDVFVMSSHLEGLGTSVLDALIMRTPVVAADAGGIPEMIEDGVTGVLVKKKDPAALKNGIKYILDNPGIAKKLSDNGYEMVKDKFDYNITAKRTLDIYKGLINR